MEQRKKLTGIQRMVAKRMVQSKSIIPHVTTIREVNMHSVVMAKQQAEQQYGRVSVLCYIIYAVARALPDFPVLNASLDNDEIVFHSELNFGIAVSVGQDLKVPVLKRVETMSFAQIVDGLKGLTRASETDSFVPSDFAGGTFTITNSGSIGGEIFTPIINYPQSAILGLGRMNLKPVVANDGSIVPRHMMYLCLSYDHRIVNGYHAVTFLGRIEQMLADAQTAFPL